MCPDCPINALQIYTSVSISMAFRLTEDTSKGHLKLICSAPLLLAGSDLQEDKPKPKRERKDTWKQGWRDRRRKR